MGNNVEMTNSEHQGIDLFNEEFLAKGGMSTEELIIRLDAIPFEVFQNGLKEKIQNYKVENSRK